jgi:hypothetical protein
MDQILEELSPKNAPYGTGSIPGSIKSVLERYQQAELDRASPINARYLVEVIHQARRRVDG